MAQSRQESVEASSDALLEVDNLRTVFRTGKETIHAVDGVSFDIYPGETVGLVGESGSGKSVTARSILGLVDTPGRIEGGELRFKGEDLVQTGWQEHRGDIAIVFQDPLNSINPVYTVGNQIREALRIHQGLTGSDARSRAVELLESVGIPDAPRRVDEYPHQFSGGMQQRAIIAIALACDPDLLVCDEPTTALDVTIQAQILDLLDTLQAEEDLAILFITHDMGVIEETADRVNVIYAGEVVERAPTDELFSNPQHPYTEALVSAVPTPNPYTRREGIELKGTVPQPSNPPSGCRFHTRCHKVIQSSDYDLEQAQWRGLLNLRSEVESGALEVDKIRQSAAVGEDVEPDAVSDTAIRQQVRTEFDLPQELPDRDAEAVLADALDRLVSDDQAEAGELLASEFVTPCEETKPEFTDHGDGHRSSCLRHRAEYQEMEVVSDD